MKVKSSFIILVLLFSLKSFGQDNGIGVRAVNIPDIVGLGVTYKHMLHGRMSYEITAGSNLTTDVGFVKADFNFVQRPISIQGLDWYSGIGVQSWLTKNTVKAGPEFTLGLDWDTVSLPIGLFLDGSFFVPLARNTAVRPVWQIGGGVRFLFE